MESLKVINDLLKCSICFNKFVSPITLQVNQKFCLIHNFILTKLNQNLTKVRRDTVSVSLRKHTPIERSI